MPFPAAPPARRSSAAEALACWQCADWPGGWEREPSLVLPGRLGEFGGIAGGGHTHAPASGGEHAQGLFCDAGFQFASAGALGHGVSCFLSHTTIWETAMGGGWAWRGGLCLWVGAGLHGACLNVPIVLPAREQEVLASPLCALAPPRHPARMGDPGKGDGAMPPEGYWGGGMGNRRGKKKRRKKRKKTNNKRTGFGSRKCHHAERGLKGKGKTPPTPLSATLGH